MSYKLTIAIIVATLIELISANSNQIFYQKIGLKPQASLEEVRKACKNLMKQLHPDNNVGDGDIHERYIEVKTICQDLTHVDKKQIYDQQGDQGLLQAKEQSNWNSRNKGPDNGADVPVTLHDLYVGTKKSFTFNKKVICDRCKGTGDKDGKLKVCKHCKGRGHVMQNVQMGIGFTMQMQQTCDRCGGKGKMGGHNCPVCRGKKVKQEIVEKTIDVKPGMTDGQKIIFHGEADQSPEYKPGNLVFTLKLKPHGYFKRVENHLYTKLDIRLKDAILGYSKNLRHLDEHYAAIESKPGEVIQPFSIKTLKGEGMPSERNANQKGDLFVKFNVKLPKKISEEDREILTKLFSIGKKTE